MVSNSHCPHSASAIAHTRLTLSFLSGQDKLAHVPYRDSKLTRLLRDALGGKSKTIIVATVGPSLSSAEETTATVEYASRARSVRCRPEVNRRVTKTGLVKDLQKEVSVLKKDLAATRAKKRRVSVPRAVRGTRIGIEG